MCNTDACYTIMLCLVLNILKPCDFYLKADKVHWVKGSTVNCIGLYMWNNVQDNSKSRKVKGTPLRSKGLKT
jgi:hypothetical protein